MKHTLTLAAVSLLTAPALAHVGHDHAGSGFAEGLMHPWFGLDHLLAMVAIGLLAVRARSSQALWLIPGGFVGGMLIGAVLSYAGLPLPGVEWLIAGSVVVLGLAVALLPKVKVGPAAALVALAGICHGHAHITEMVGAAIPYGGGMLLGTALLHAMGIGLGLALVATKSAPLVRVAGAAMALAFAVTLLPF